jgi:hypothetical protein
MPKINDFLNLIWTLALAYFAWIFFRANTLSDAIVIIGNIFNPATYNLDIQLFDLVADFYLSFILIGILIVIEILWEKYGLIEKLIQTPRILKYVMFFVVVFTIFVLGKWDESDFLYFQF